MEEKDFTLLATLDDTKNITRAADILFTTQSALSKRIITLENELGVNLMTRSRQGIHFTPAGEIVLSHAKKISRVLENMKSELEQSREYICGSVNAGISINYARYFLPDMLANFQKNFPKVTTHIETGHSRNIFTRLLKNEIDIAILRGSYDWKEEKILLSTENICAILGREHAGKKLSQVPYIARSTDAVFEREIMQWLRENNLRSDANIFVDSIGTCTEMVRRGIGWAIVPEICLKNFDGEVKKLFFADGKPFTRSTFLLYSRDVVKLPQVNAFIQSVKIFHEQEK